MTTLPTLSRLFLPALICASQSVLGFAALAQTVESISKREIARRQAAFPQGEEALAR
jgi:hypothetical protein